MKHLLPAVQRTALRIPWAAVGGCAAALLLTAAAPGGQYAPWALAAVAAVGVGWQGLLAVVCAGLGALLFMDFQPGLRHTAAALLIFCANTALCNTRLYRRPRFRPMAAVCAAGLTQLPYLIQRGGRQWALCMASLALLYGAAALLPDLLPESAAEQADKRRAWFLLLLGVCAVPAGWTVMGFSPAAVLTALLLGEVRPLAVLCQLLTAAGVWLLLPEKEGMLLTAAGEVAPEAAAPAAAFRAVYDSLEDHAPLLRPENPAVLFDRAAEQVCRDCPLRSDCWQTHYTDTYNAFNDACPALLRRGQALAEDFPPYFAARCVRFPKLLTALDGQLHDFLQRRLHHGRLDAAYRLAREQYRQVAEVLSRTAPAERLRRAHLTCRTAALLRPKTGEKHCGDQCAVFDAGGLTCLALSDGMGSGESAHCEAAMTIRLLRQFLQAGIEPLPALKTLNTAAMLRCQGGAGFTTIDLACLDRAEGVLTLYKYGAAPSYIKRQGAVARYRAQALPAGLERADGDVPPQRIAVSPGTWLVQVSDGVAGEDDEWLQDLLAGWDGTSPRALAEELLRQSVQRTGGADDCAVLVLAIDGKADPHRV